MVPQYARLPLDGVEQDSAGVEGETALTDRRHDARCCQCAVLHRLELRQLDRGLDGLELGLDGLDQQRRGLAFDLALADGIDEPLDCNVAVTRALQVRQLDVEGLGFGRRLGRTPESALNASVSCESIEVPEYQPLTDLLPRISGTGSPDRRMTTNTTVVTSQTATSARTSLGARKPAMPRIGQGRPGPRSREPRPLVTRRA